jgi:hypothetical protein
MSPSPIVQRGPNSHDQPAVRVHPARFGTAIEEHTSSPSERLHIAAQANAEVDKKGAGSMNWLTGRQSGIEFSPWPPDRSVHRWKAPSQLYQRWCIVDSGFLSTMMPTGSFDGFEHNDKQYRTIRYVRLQVRAVTSIDSWLL